MSVETINSVKPVQMSKIQSQKPAFGQNAPQKQESEDKTGLIVAGLVAAAAIGAATVMIIKGKGNKAVKEATQAVSNKPANVAQEAAQASAGKGGSAVQDAAETVSNKGVDTVQESASNVTSAVASKEQSAVQDVAQDAAETVSNKGADTVQESASNVTPAVEKMTEGETVVSKTKVFDDIARVQLHETNVIVPKVEKEIKKLNNLFKKHHKNLVQIMESITPEQISRAPSKKVNLPYTDFKLRRSGERLEDAKEVVVKRGKIKYYIYYTKRQDEFVARRQLIKNQKGDTIMEIVYPDAMETVMVYGNKHCYFTPSDNSEKYKLYKLFNVSQNIEENDITFLYRPYYNTSPERWEVNYMAQSGESRRFHFGPNYYSKQYLNG